MTPAPTFKFPRFKRGDKAHWRAVHKLLPWIALLLLLVPAGWFATRGDDPEFSAPAEVPVASGESESQGEHLKPLAPCGTMAREAASPSDRVRGVGERGAELASPDASPLSPGPSPTRGEGSTPCTTEQDVQLAVAPPVTDIFMVRTWEPPLPPPAPDVTPPPPPPLPFRFIGRINEPGQPTKFLLAEVGTGRVVHAARVGDVIATNYRLESYAGGRLVFRFSPMNVRQMLEIGETP